MAGVRFQEASRTQDTPVVAAIVLAAGRSVRFHSTKQLADIQGIGLLQATLDVVRSSAVRDIVLVLGFEAHNVMDSLDLSGIEAVYNPDFDEGMSTSIKTGIRALGQDVSGALIVLGDQPSVRPVTIDRLVEAYRTRNSLAVVPIYQGKRGNPVMLDLSLRPVIELLEGDVGCKAILEGLEGVEALETEDPGILIDVDTREDLDSLLRRMEAEEVND